jgi:hypothetical protein
MGHASAFRVTPKHGERAVLPSTSRVLIMADGGVRAKSSSGEDGPANSMEAPPERIAAAARVDSPPK